MINLIVLKTSNVNEPFFVLIFGFSFSNDRFLLVLTRFIPILGFLPD